LLNKKIISGPESSEKHTYVRYGSSVAGVEDGRLLSNQTGDISDRKGKID
jgi:hypothetical protein